MFGRPTLRAARLLQILLLLQNRGRITSAQLASELEVTRRTILRDVDALTEAGLPILVHQGNQGGIELGFNYRTRLTGLAADEAEAVGLMLTWPLPGLDALGLGDAAERGRRKVLESFPDQVRATITLGRSRFRVELPPEPLQDPRIRALADAVRQAQVVRLNAKSRSPRTIRPVALVLGAGGWFVVDGGSTEAIALDAWGDINVSAAPAASAP